MRTNNIKCHFVIKFPYDKPDENGNVYTREAVDKAIRNMKGPLPIVMSNKEETKIIGITDTSPYAIQDLTEEKAIQFTVDGNILHGGTECQVVHNDEGKISEINLVAIGLSE